MKKSKLESIIIRGIGFPFFAALSLIAAIILWVRYMVNFIKHGGEAVVYTNKMNPTTMPQLFAKMTELTEKLNEKQ